ncbi:MAG TPA: hypothetical protein VM344_01880 [Vitreimonas sp.]|nr:hypothetical protein [Vitreimonas sp.]
MSTLTLFRASVAVFVVLSLILTWIAIEIGVPFRLGGAGQREQVAADALTHGTGISAPLVFLVVFVVLLALSGLPGRWKAIPLFAAAIAGGVGLVAGVAEIPLGSGPFAYPIGGLGIAIWFLSIATAVVLVVSAITAAISIIRRHRATELR